MKTSPVDIGMDDEPREQISELEVQIEELAGALERCRKTALASKAAMAFGGILLAATTLGVVTFDPMVMVTGLAALLGGAERTGRKARAIETVEEQRTELPLIRREVPSGAASVLSAGTQNYQRQTQ
jgi:hypothetical protein